MFAALPGDLPNIAYIWRAMSVMWYKFREISAKAMIEMPPCEDDIQGQLIGGEFLSGFDRPHLIVETVLVST